MKQKIMIVLVVVGLLLAVKKQAKADEESFFYSRVTIYYLNVRSGPGTEFPIVHGLLKGAVVRIEKIIQTKNGVWYKILQDPWLRYPKRVTSDWYIASWYTEKLSNRATITVFSDTRPEQKWIEVDLSEQKLRAFEGNKLVFETLVSTGLVYPTPKGEFRVLWKSISDYMQGSIYGEGKYFDLPGVPFVIYFTWFGHAIHGTYWHEEFGRARSIGCVNLPAKAAEWLFWWTEPHFPMNGVRVYSQEGTKIVIHD